jgi:hypothetical protein
VNAKLRISRQHARSGNGRATAGTNNWYNSNRSEVRETQEDSMAKSNRESKKPKKEKVKTIAAAPSQKGATAGWQPTFGSGKKK